MATIEAYETANGAVRYMVRYRTPEHRQTKKRGFKTRRDANAFAATVETSKLRGEFIAESAGRATVGAFASRWLAHKAIRKPSYVNTLESAWRVHVEPRWGALSVGRVKRSAVQEWLTTLSADRSPSVVRRAHDVLAGALDLAVDDRAMLTNPARGVELPAKRKGSHSYLTIEQVGALAAEAGKNGPFVWFLATTGLRWGEAVALQGKHLRRSQGRVRVEQSVTRVGANLIITAPKTGEIRDVPVARAVMDAIPETPPDALVWPDLNTGHIRHAQKTTGWFAGAVRRCQAKDATFPTIHPHDLRHTAASIAVSAGANVKVVQRMLGHASAAMTLDRYTDLFDADLDSLSHRLDGVLVTQAEIKCAQNVPEA